MIRKFTKKIQKIQKQVLKQEEDEIIVDNNEFGKFKLLGRELDIPEIVNLEEKDFTDTLKINLFLKYSHLRDLFVERYLGDYKYYRNIEDLENDNINIEYFLNLPLEEKNILTDKRMLLFINNKGEKLLGLYVPSIYFSFVFDDIFIFGNNVYNYFFGKGKDLSFLNSNNGINLEELLQSMETMGINDIGIDPINENQYIITAEINKQNVLLTQRPLLKQIIIDIFHKAMTEMGIDHTTKFPTVTGLLKIDLIGQNGVHIARTFRINFIRVKMGYTASIRKFMNYTEIEKLGLDGLGYIDEAKDLINEAIADKSGINMILGETNSGKSTLLAAILNKIHKQKQKIISIENPIEIEVPYLQIDLSDTETADEKYKMTKELAQKGALRHNPNVVLMSEIRTADEIEFFAGLGLRGHMALATLHAGSVENAIGILLKVSDEQELKSIMNIFIHQELLAKKCNNCKGEKVLENGSTCNVCSGSGAKGVVPIYEIMKFEHLGKEDSLKDLKRLYENGKIKYVSKVKMARDLYEQGALFEEDYKRVVKNNIEFT